MSWKIDPSNSKIVFTVRHLMITRVHGKMDRFSGLIEFDLDHPANSSVRADIDPASVNTRLGIRDANVRSALLKVKKHPKITYQSKQIEVVDDSHGRIYGDLTIHGIAKQVVLDVEYNGLSQNQDGMTTAAFHAVTRLNRKDWGLKWMPLLEIGGLFVADQLEVDIQVVAVKESNAMPQRIETSLAEVMPAQDEVV
jgi:polyisoprenoid-binding protein YceI